jgi:hypothetical protein
LAIVVVDQSILISCHQRRQVPPERPWTEHAALAAITAAQRAHLSVKIMVPWSEVSTAGWQAGPRGLDVDVPVERSAGVIGLPRPSAFRLR